MSEELQFVALLLVVAINLLAWRQKAEDRRVRFLPGALLLLILFQAALGMWTVTLKLMPLVVMKLALWLAA